MQGQMETMLSDREKEFSKKLKAQEAEFEKALKAAEKRAQDAGKGRVRSRTPRRRSIAKRAGGGAVCCFDWLMGSCTDAAKCKKNLPHKITKRELADVAARFPKFKTVRFDDLKQ